jgi:hypothetical protein
MSGLHRNYKTERDSFRQIEVIKGGVAASALAAVGEGADRRRGLRAGRECSGGGGSPGAAPQSDLRLARIFAAERRRSTMRCPTWSRDALRPATESGPVMCGEAGRIEVIASGITIRVCTGFDSGDLRRVLQIVRKPA